jgi:hypothetical protein
MRRVTFVVVFALLVFPTGFVVSADKDHLQFSFSLDRVEEGKVWLASGKGCPWDTVSYGGGAFFVWEEGVETAMRGGRSADAPKLALKLDESLASLVVTCQAKRCNLAGPAHSKMKSQDLSIGESATVPVVSGFRFSVFN